ncbi:malonate transporter subunit MadL [Alkalihalophilus lindianensis]|uniref:Malonate transporter subunit MadL n=1 Tax=Alkalihalophilus lindianensis TaxID=1630542 RepID=A0ABU3XDJ7_9BACI|nr:malonate transporter subunit MadL [Alkalihalophilus lindianensis]MDV2685958.1 malonate transporter subunit MadL [Alkalihalophilus lindianensis]
MVIYGVALLSVCMLVGVLFGDLIGSLIGVSANVGGVGIGMVLLVLVIDYLRRKKKLDIPSEEGIKFWSAIYIPVVVAMAAQQNVVSAIAGGPVAILSGTLAVIVSFALVPVISKVGKDSNDTFDHTHDA